MSVHEQNRKETASRWFEDLRNSICDAFETLEDEQVMGPHADLPAGRFELRQTSRGTDGDGGVGRIGIRGSRHIDGCHSFRKENRHKVRSTTTGFYLGERLIN